MSSLSSLLDACKKIALVGICKNAGKTTVLNYLVESYYRVYKLGITSIGYDGEDKDAVTGLKKPKVLVYKGMLVATASECIEKSHVEYELVEDTKIRTVLGNIMLILIKSNGVLEISGPSISSQMKYVCELMDKYYCNKILIDGAAGRKTHVVGANADCMVLSVGAALSNNMDKVIRDANFIVDLMMLKKIQNEKLLSIMKSSDEKSEYQTVIGHSTITKDFDDHYNEKKHDEVYCLFNGAVVDSDLSKIIKRYKKAKKTIIVNNPTSLFISERQFYRLISQNGSICVRTSINIVAVTINPMTPYDKWFDEEIFLKSMQQSLTLPVFNVLK